MGSGCEILIAANLPSSARQLPILAALHARASTLFGAIIHHGEKKVNTFFENIDMFLSNYCHCEGAKRPWQSPGHSRNLLRLPRQCAHWLAMTCFSRAFYFHFAMDFVFS